MHYEACSILPSSRQHKAITCQQTATTCTLAAIPWLICDRSVMQVCLFSYGQTGAGKTHTMQGTHSADGRGITPRALEQVNAAKHSDMQCQLRQLQQLLHERNCFGVRLSDQCSVTTTSDPGVSGSAKGAGLAIRAGGVVPGGVSCLCTFIFRQFP